MKKTTTQIVTLCAAIFAGITGCSTPDESGKINESNQLYVKVDRAVGSRSVTTPVSPTQADTPLVFNSGFLYFVSGSGQITMRLDVTNDASPVSSTSVGIQTLEAGTTIIMPDQTLEVALVANVPAGITLPSSGAFSVVTAQTITLNSQYDATGGVTVATLWGDSQIVPGAGGNPATATIEVHPLISRIEIAQLTGGTGIMGTWMVTGIFMNQYDNQKNLNNTRFTSFQDNGSMPANYISPSTGYPTADNGRYFDYNAAGIGALTGSVYAPATAGNVFAYNLFSGNISHLVIRLDNITGFINPQFLTVRSFRTSGNVLITSFEPGKIYRIANLAFTSNDLSEVPEPQETILDVIVDLVPWTYVDNIQPGF